MSRLWAFSFFALLPFAASFAQAGGQKDDGKPEQILRLEDKLEADDPKDKDRNAPRKIHTIQLKAGNVYTIDMVSKEFDTYLRLEDKAGVQLAEDDDSGGEQNARIDFSCTKDGEYKIICTAFAPEGAGNFTLTVKRTTNNIKLVTSHQQLIGKAAPGFKSDFTLNGEAKQLDDLRGKVVLLGFWEVRSGPSAETFPLLVKWNEAFKNDGLAVVGVTFFNSELGQKSGFDKESGKVVPVEKADRKSDEAMFKEFADHHKLDYTLMTLRKDEALKTFDAYGVNGMPQLVLIDRSGVVKSVVVGEKNAAGLEQEIKRVLAEK
jgi:peroxiredoxin